MKKNTRPSIDGFIPRRSGSQLGDLHEREIEKPIDRSLHTGESTRQAVVGVAREVKTIGRADLDESLHSLDDPYEKSTRRSRRAQKKLDKQKRPKSKVKRIIKWTLIILLIIGLGLGGYLLFKAVNASDSVFKGSFFDIIKNDPLKQDANGRSNFLILGTSEDDPGHQGANLTDTIMVLSINQTTKDAYTFSVPRDLTVKYGQACLSGYSGKVNVYFSCSNDGTDAASEQDRLAKTQTFIGDIIGMDIQYGIHVNYTVMRDVVNAIGGNITVKIEGDQGQGPDPKIGIMDANFDWKCGANYAKRKMVCPPDGHFIDYKPGPQVLDAEHALYLAQARGDTTNIGLAQSNFDRERNQQKIVFAIREKAMSSGTLTNINAVSQLVDALGNNLRTNIQTKEIRTLLGLAKDIPSDKINSIDLHSANAPIFDGSGQPTAGTFSYNALRAYLNKVITQEPFVKESPHVTVLNGSGTAGMAQIEADKLTAKGFIVDTVNNAPDTTNGSAYPAVTIYQLTDKKPLSATKLKTLYAVTLNTTKPPLSVVGATDFLIIIGPSQ